MTKCLWCGKEFKKHYNNQVCCSKACQEERNRELAANRQHRYYHKHKEGNVNKKALTLLGSKGTSCTTKPKKSFDEEHKSIIKEARRLGFKIKKSDEVPISL